MNVARGESFPCKAYKRIPNTYQWSETPIYFMARPADRIEKKQYRVQKAVANQETSVLLFASNLTHNLEIDDKVVFMDREWTVVSVGYYPIESRLLTGKIMNPERIIQNSPKGIGLS